MKIKTSFLFGLTIQLVLSNVNLSGTVLLDEVSYKGGTALGIRKDLFLIGFSIVIILFVLGQINNFFNNELLSIKLYKKFFISRLFFLWIIMEVYLLNNKFILQYIPTILYLLIYIIACIQLFYFQKYMILNFDKK